jgi:hypothetical protein
MNPVGSQSSTSFCDVSKAQIQNYVNNFGSCLNVVGTTNPTPTPSGSYTLVASPSTIASGGQVTVNWTAPSGSSSLDYIGVYGVGTANSEYIGLIGTFGATSGSFTGVLTDPGQFEFRYLINNSFTSVATSNIVTVQSNPTPTPNVTPTPVPTPIVTPTPNVTPTPVATPTPNVTPTPNATPTVTPTPVATPTPTSGRTNVALASQGSVASASSQFRGSYSPDLAINGIRNWAGGLGGWKDATADSYPDWLQIDFNGSKTIDEISVFGVTDDYTNPVDPTEETTFSLYGLTALDVQYWNGASWVTVPNGSVTNNTKVWTKLVFSAVKTTSIRVLVNSSLTGYSRIVEVEAWSSGGGTVTPTPTVSASSSSVAPGGTLTVGWSGVSSPSITDWIGVFNIGAGDFEYLSYIYTSSGNQSAGSSASSAGSSLIGFPTTPGTYELRLNRNNRAVRVATSSPITVR